MTSYPSTSSPQSDIDNEIRLAIANLRTGDRQAMERMDQIMGDVQKTLSGISNSKAVAHSIDDIQAALDGVRKELTRHEALIAESTEDARMRSSQEQRAREQSVEALANVADILSVLDKTVAGQEGKWPELERTMAELSSRIASLSEGFSPDGMRRSVEPVLAAMDTRLVELAKGLEGAMTGLFRLLQSSEQRGQRLETSLSGRIAKVASAVDALRDRNSDDQPFKAIEQSISGLDQKVSDVSERISAFNQDTALRLEAKQSLITERLARVLKAIQEQQPAQRADIAPVADAVGSLDKRMDTVLQKVEGLSLKTTRLEFIAGETARASAEDQRVAKLETSVTGFGTKLEEVSTQIASLHQDAAVRAEAKQTLVAEKLNRILKAVQEKEPAPQPDLQPITGAFEALDKRFDAVDQKLEGVSLKATRLEFLAGEAQTRAGATSPEAGEQLRSAIETAVVEMRNAQGFASKLDSVASKLDGLEQAARAERRAVLEQQKLGVEEIANAISRSEARVLEQIEASTKRPATAIAATHPEQAPAGAASDPRILALLERLEARLDQMADRNPSSDDLMKGLAELTRMTAAGNEVLADLHAVSTSAPNLTAKTPVPSWAEAWQIFSAIAEGVDRRCLELGERLESVVRGLEKKTGAEAEHLPKLAGLKSGFADLKSEFAQDVERFLSIAASLSSEMEDLAPKVLAAQYAPRRERRV